MAGHDPDAEFHARPSGFDGDYGMAAARTDVLSQVLTLIRLRGELVYKAEMSSPWGIAFPAGPAHFHFVEHGSLWVAAEGAPPFHIGEGGLLLLPHGSGHMISDDPATPAIGINALVFRHFNAKSLTLSYGGGGAATRIVGGFFRFEGSPFPPIMSALPALIHLPRGENHATRRLRAIVHYLIEEAHQPRPGSALMISRLIDLLVIRALRTWAATRPNNLGWLGGLGEERIGRALAAIHADPYRRWTVQTLADIAGMSRSVFAQRFTATVGEPPLRYLSRYRLTVASDLLRAGGLKVSDVARRVGFASDAAFSRAFKAYFGYAPIGAKRG